MTDASFPEYRTCMGPAHERPVRLPLTGQHWYFHHGAWAHRTGMVGKPVSRCKLCWQWTKIKYKPGPHGLVPASEILPWLTELVLRCDTIYSASQRHELPETTLRRTLHGEHPKMRRATAAKILAALRTQRKHDRQHGVSESYRKAAVARVTREANMSFRVAAHFEHLAEERGAAP